MCDIEQAMDDLTYPERRAISCSTAELRDRYAAAGEPRLARWWHALAVAAAEAQAREELLLRALDPPSAARIEDDTEGGTPR